ncbi:MAG: hypothetical protein ACYDEY_08115 [Acidimicrobiales bacterium]
MQIQSALPVISARRVPQGSAHASERSCHGRGIIDFRLHGITVHLDRPDHPHLARALGLLIEEINLKAPCLCGDDTTITYVLESRST